MTKEEAIKMVQAHKFPRPMEEWQRLNNEAIDMAIEALSAKPQTDLISRADAVPQLKQTDTLIIADALRYLAQDTERHLVDRTRADALRQQFLKYGASMCKGGAE